MDGVELDWPESGKVVQGVQYYYLPEHNHDWRVLGGYLAGVMPVTQNSPGKRREFC